MRSALVFALLLSLSGCDKAPDEKVAVVDTTLPKDTAPIVAAVDAASGVTDVTAIDAGTMPATYGYEPMTSDYLTDVNAAARDAQAAADAALENAGAAIEAAGEAVDAASAEYDE